MQARNRDSIGSLKVHGETWTVESWVSLGNKQLLTRLRYVASRD